MLEKFKKYYPLILIAPFVIIRLFIIRNSSLTFFSDDAIYASFARFWFEHDFAQVFHPFWPPLYPFVSSLIFPIIRDWEITLQVVSLITSLILLIPIYFLAKHFTSKLGATLASISTFLITPIVEKSIFPMSDMLATSLIISSLVTFYFALVKNETKLFVLSAALLGLTYLTRSEGTMFFGLSLVYLAGYTMLGTLFKKLPKKNLKTIPLFLITFLIIISPYAIATHNQLGFWTLSQKFNAQIQQGQAFEIRNNTTWAQEIWSVKSPSFNSRYWRDGGEFVLNNFYRLQKSFTERVEKWQDLLLSYFPLWLLAISAMGLFWIKRKTVWSDFFIIYILVIAVPITVFSTSVIDIRYLLWVIPFLVLLFYKGLFNLLQKFPPSARIILSFVLVILTPAFSLYPLDVSAYSQGFTKAHYRPQLVEIAQFTKEHTTSGEPKIMTRHEAIEFYARGKTIYIPQLPYSEVVNYAKKNDVDYIIAWHRELIQEEQLKTLSDPNIPRDELKIELFLGTPEGNMIVYTLK